MASVLVVVVVMAVLALGAGFASGCCFAKWLQDVSKRFKTDSFCLFVLYLVRISFAYLVQFAFISIYFLYQ